MKRGELLIFVGILVLLIVPLISAGVLSDFWSDFKEKLGKITGYVESDTTVVNITVGNNLPTIGVVEVITAKNPTDDTTTTIEFNFTATDEDGASDLNPATAEGRFNRTGETTRVNTSCIELTTSGNDANYSCTIDMWYFDQNGAWSINVTIQDDQSASAENASTTFTYNSLPGMKMNQTSLTWTTVAIGQTNIGSNNDPIQINNTGNAEPKNINVTSYHLQGEITTTDYILVGNLTIENASQGCSGTQLVNATSINITSAILYKGNHSLNYDNATSGQELIFFCITEVPSGISQQSYSSAEYGSWTVEIV